MIVHIFGFLLLILFGLGIALVISFQSNLTELRRQGKIPDRSAEFQIHVLQGKYDQHETIRRPRRIFFRALKVYCLGVALVFAVIFVVKIW